MPSQLDAIETYRLIVTRHNATEIVLSPKGSEWALPRVEIRKFRRIAEQLTSEALKGWEFETCCLFLLNSQIPDQEEGVRSALLECAKNNQKAPAGAYWMPVDVATQCSNREEAALIRKAFAELSLYTRGAKVGPFAKPGWLRELFQWTYEQIAPFGRRLTGEFRQYNASPTFSLIRLETTDGAIWFKATGEPNARELPVTLLLARLFPNHLPRILGVHSAWNGWLSDEAEGVPLDELTECSTWERAAEALAELQIESIGQGRELVDGGCKDMRLPEVQKLIEPFVSRMSELMRVQKKDSPPPLSGSELASLGEGLRDSLSLLESLRLPDTLGHLDCNPGNFVISAAKCVFLDWAEACVTNPVVSFEYLRRHLERSGLKQTAADARITAAYIRPWSSLFSSDDLQRAIAAVSPVAVLIHAAANDTWRTLNPISNPTLAGYYRALTRRMYRDAVVAAERSERCLS